MENDLHFSALDAIYDAASDMEKWPAALDAVSQRFSSVGGTLVLPQPGGGTAAIVSPSLTKAGLEYEQNAWKLDFLVPRAISASFDRQVDAYSDRDLASEDEIAAHPFYTEFRAPHGLGPLLSGTLAPHTQAPVVFAVHGAIDRQPYSPQEAMGFLFFMRHVERALLLTMRIAEAEVQREALAAALGRLTCGVFFLDADGRVIYENATARDRLAGLFAVAAGRLALKGEAGPQWKQAVATALGATEDDGRTPAPPILVRDPGGGGAVALYVIPLRRGPAPLFETFTMARAMVVVLPQDPAGPADPSLLRDLLGLTLGEARVASLVGAGQTPRETAEALRITEQTARTVLKRVFAKVGVSRQAELARLLARITLAETGP